MKLYVGNFPREVTETDLREAFAAFGKVTGVTLVRDRSNGVSKGFGYVEMPVDEEALKAKAELYGKALKGGSLDVSEARPRPQRSSPGGRGGGRGGRRGGGRRSW